MKRKLCGLLACLMICLLCFTACGDDETPEGYELACDPDVTGYCLYVPQGWNYDYAGGVTTAYLSSLNTANLTVAYAVDPETDSIADYWVACEEELREDFADYQLITPPTDYRIGGGMPGKTPYAGYYVEYRGSFGTLTYRFRQYFVLLGEALTDGLCVLTYTAADTSTVEGETDDFTNSVDEVQDIVSFFRLTSRPGAVTTDQAVLDDKNAPDGWKRANRFEYLGMDVYVPKAWAVQLSDGYISITPGKGAGIGIYNVNLTTSVGGDRNTLTERMEYYGLEYHDSEKGFTLIDYWELLKKEYEDYFADGTFRVLSEEPVWEGDNKTEPNKVGDTSYYAFTFSGEKYGESYRVTLYIFRETNDRKNVFRTLLYTTENTDSAHEAYASLVIDVLEQVRY